jgi:uncharacterized membrane protein YczE
MIKRILLLLSGYILIALGVVVILITEIGSSAIDALNFYIGDLISLSMGVINILTGSIIIITLYLITKKKELFTSITAILLIGPFINLFIYLYKVLFNNYKFDSTILSPIYLLRLFIVFVGMQLCVIGSTLNYKSKLSSSPLDVLTKTIGNKIGNIKYGKWIVELSLLIISLFLAIISNKLHQDKFSQLSIISILMSFIYGPLYAFYSKLLIKEDKKEDNVDVIKQIN